MNKILLILVLIFFFQGCDFKRDFKYVKISDNKKIKPRFEPLVKRYKEYWECMSKKDFDCSYRYEMPYQRFLHSLKWYKNFNTPNKKHYMIKLLDIKPVDKYTVVVKSAFVSADNKVNYMFHDRWYNVNNLWFHKMKVSILPFGENVE